MDSFTVISFALDKAPATVQIPTDAEDPGKSQTGENYCVAFAKDIATDEESASSKCSIMITSASLTYTYLSHHSRFEIEEWPKSDGTPVRDKNEIRSIPKTSKSRGNTYYCISMLIPSLRNASDSVKQMRNERPDRTGLNGQQSTTIANPN
ncbi:hypothetical protein NMY22_g7892 [Coprinellus aureogranulatus]|nr:hypothetical protein NMY22_g7892 [Coprinellus aureogranulatus]